jgi:hypothetical protein
MDPHLTPEIRVLIEGPLTTRMHVEVLLILRRTAPGGCSVDTLGALLGGCGATVVARCVADLVQAGLLVRMPGGLYHYTPTTTRLDRSIASLAQLQADRPLSLVRALALRATGMRSPERDGRAMRRRALLLES